MENETAESIASIEEEYIAPKILVNPLSAYPDDIQKVFFSELRMHVNFLLLAIILMAGPTILIVVNEGRLAQVCGSSFLQQYGGCSSYARLYTTFLVFLAGIVGASLYAIRGVTKAIELHYWNYDRLLWRRCFPLVGGVVALFMCLLNTGNIISPFEVQSFNRPTFASAYGFVVGYFADSVLQALSKVAGDFLEKFHKKKEP